jgi:predicted GH43/DUF377 family glycosyl hydrolase
MKNLILTFLLSTLVFWGCSNKNKDSLISSQQEIGKIQLKIDRANAPADVVTIDAILTREGYDHITGTLNLLTDSTADILLDEIPAGVWYLKVDAKDDVGTILYTGETEVEIIAGFITQVNLTLNPTGGGVGSIYIFVTWGTITNSNWMDYIDNPILQSSGQFWDLEGVHQPKVIFENNIFKMYYSGHEGAGSSHVGYAESFDGINWNSPFQDPILSPGEPGLWDSHSTVAGSIIIEDGVYKLYYIGWSDNWGNWDIGLATSTDGLNWNKYAEPVLYGTSGWEFQVASASVVKYDNTYYLFYTGRNLPHLSIGLATSSDGINWTRYSDNPILTYTEPWEENGVYHPSVTLDNEEFKMIFMNSSGMGFGFAYSSDGVNWTKDNVNPFFTTENTTNGWADYKIAYPYLIKTENNTRIYYTGMSSTGGFWKIGFARKFGN